MAYLGFMVSSFIYLTVFFLLILYLFSAVFKKYALADKVLSLLFLHSIFSLLVILWAIAVMRHGSYSDLNIGMDYTMVLFLVIPIFLMMECMDIGIRKACYKGCGTAKSIYRFFLPALTGAVFSTVTVAYYFSCRYFITLITW